MRTLSSHALAALAILASHTAFAQTDEAALPAISVTADKIDSAAQSAHQARHDSPNQKTVIDAEQLNQFGDQPLGDAMRRLVGVSFEGANRAREVQLRNIGREYTQVTVNGRRMLDGNAERTVQVDRIPSSMVERIEIIHTPLASQDAQGAAGTVNIILKQGNKALPNEISVGAGALQHNGPIGDATIHYALGDERIRLTLSGGIQQQRRAENKDALSYNAAGAANGGSRNINQRRFEQANFTPRIDININKDNSLVIEPSYLRTTEYRDDIKRTLSTNQQTVTQLEDEDRKRTRENKGLYGAWKHQFSSNTELNTSFDRQQASEDTMRDSVRYNASNVIDQRRKRLENIDLDLLKVKTFARTAIDKHTFEYGIGRSEEKRREDNSGFNLLNGTPLSTTLNRRYNIEEDITSLYIQDTMQLFPGNLLTVGVRQERSATNTRDFFGNATDKKYNALLPSLSLRQALNESTDLRMGAAKTFRRPSLRELSPTVSTVTGNNFATPDSGGNPDATPETILGYDIGIDHFLAGRQGLLSAKAFRREFSNKLENITTLEGTRYVSRPQNTGDGSMVGIELEARIPLNLIGGSRDVTLWSNLTAVKTSLISTQTGEKRRFLDQPDRIANIGLDWFVPSAKTTFGASLNLSSGFDQLYRQSSGLLARNKVDSLKRFDMSARTQLTPRTSLNVSALNLFASKERRMDQEFSAADALTKTTYTNEPTYRSIYVRLSHLF
ncbi:TonB-dependent receptor [uncultured Oxalicibacterium sp.]|uniref:TonB-dependent receptor plug domain-containing protein n=1 Tax=uncultured Oxalicibacterium sp. TaxID=1168540 RepID=UPI0025F90152|nr:TonB-dependent receptor [uncultured Oxalicibacterium sp.]